jgi:hypothetical protein
MGKIEESQSSENSGVDKQLLSWIEGKIKDTNEHFEKRLSDDRNFIKGTVGLAAKIWTGSIVVIFAVAGFFGYKDIASIDGKIDKSVSDKIKDKSDEFKGIFEKDIQGLADQAIITAYNIQFGVPPKRFERPTILPTHLQRFVQILADEKSDPKLIDGFYDLLSDPSRDGNSPLVNNRLRQLVSGVGSDSWIKQHPERLAVVINLLRDREIIDVKHLVRAHLENVASAPAVQRSAMLYAERVGDDSVLQNLLSRLGDGKRNPAEELLFVVASIDPQNKWISDWMAKLKKPPENPDGIKEFRESLLLTAKVAARLMESIERRSSLVENSSDARKLSFAASSVSSIINAGGRISIVPDHFSDKPGENYRLATHWESDNIFYSLEPSLLLGRGGSVVTRICRGKIAEGAVGGLANFLNATNSLKDGFRRVNYDLRVTLDGSASIDADVEGKPARISKTSASLSPVLGSSLQDVQVSWRTNEGIVKKGNVTRFNGANEATFTFRIIRAEQQ